MISDDFVIRQKSLLHAFGLETRAPEVDHQQLWSAITKDKKATVDGVSFVLPTQLGIVQSVAGVTRQEVQQAVADSQVD